MLDLHRKVAILSLYLIFFVDLLALVVFIVVLGPMMLENGSSLALSKFSNHERYFLMGLLLAAYPAIQLLSNPILGAFSDWWGARKILLYSTLGSAIASALSAVAIAMGSYLLLLFSRLFAGLVSGTMTVSQSGVSSLTVWKTKGRHMSTFATLRGLGWVVGPLLAGLLSNNKLSPIFNYSTPFWMIALLFAIAYILVLFSVRTPSQSEERLRHTHFLKAFLALTAVFKMPKMTLPFLMGSLNRAGWSFFILFSSTYMVEKFHLHRGQISEFFTYSAAWYLASGIFCQLLLYKIAHTNLLLVIFLFLQAAAVAAILPFLSAEILWWVLPVTSLAGTVVMTGFYLLYSGLAGGQNQGKIFGSWNASLALSSASIPLLNGWLAGYWLEFPFFLSAAILFVTALYFLVWYLRHQSHFVEESLHD